MRRWLPSGWLVLTAMLVIMLQPPRGAMASVTIGYFHACMHNASAGRAACWGSNSNGELGYGDQIARGDFPDEMGDALSVVDLGTGWCAGRIEASGNGYHTCAVNRNSTEVKCWGDNGAGQLGYGDTNDRGDAPDEMGDDLQVVAVVGAAEQDEARVSGLALGSEHTCVLLNARTVKCFGANGNGQLGLGDSDSRGNAPWEMGANLSAVDVGTNISSVMDVAAGDLHTCVLLRQQHTQAQQLKCWGANDHGQLGQGDIQDRGDGAGEMGDALVPVALGVLLQPVQQTCGYRHTCVLLNDSSVKCFGYNGFGQLGYGDSEARGDEPGEMGSNLSAIVLGSPDSSSAPAVLSISAGGYHTCALLAPDGSVKCWGDGFNGQLGYGDAESRGDAAGEMGDSLPLVNIKGNATHTTVTAIHTGGLFTCAELGNRSLWSSADMQQKCWGDNTFGQLGQGDTDNRGDAAREMGDQLPIVSLPTMETCVDVPTAIANDDDHGNDKQDDVDDDDGNDGHTWSAQEVGGLIAGGLVTLGLLVAVVHFILLRRREAAIALALSRSHHQRSDRQRFNADTIGTERVVDDDPLLG